MRLSAVVTSPVVRFGTANPAPPSTEVQILQAHIDTLFAADPVLKQCHEISQQQPDTVGLHSTGNPPVFTPQRKALHDKILKETFDDFALRLQKAGPLPARKFVHVVTGLPGSGKSSKAIDQLALQHPTAYVLDMDELATKLPEYQVPIPFTQYNLHQKNGLGASAVHREALYLAQQVFEKLIAGNHSWMMSYVGEKTDREFAMLQRLKSAGYDVTLHHVGIEPKTAIDRAVTRFRQTGRYVPLSYIAQLNRSSTDGFHKLVARAQAAGLIQGFTYQENN